MGLFQQQSASDCMTSAAEIYFLIVLNIEAQDQNVGGIMFRQPLSSAAFSQYHFLVSLCESVSQCLLVGLSLRLDRGQPNNLILA